MGLIPAVQHGLGRIVAHARRAHLVDACARRKAGPVLVGIVPRLDIDAAGRLQHRHRVVGTVPQDLAFVRTGTHVDVRRRNAEAVGLCRMQRHAIVLVRQHFAEQVQMDGPGTRLPQSLLQLGADARLPLRPLPARSRRTALEAPAAQDVAVIFGDVRVTRDVDSRRRPPGIVAILESRQFAVGTEDFAVLRRLFCNKYRK